MTRSVRAASYDRPATILQVDSLLDAFNEEYPDEYKAADIRRLCRSVDCGETRSQELPWFWRVSKEDSFAKFQVKGIVCSLQSSVKSLTVDDIYAAPGILPNLAAQIPRPRHDLATNRCRFCTIHIASPVFRWSEKSGFRSIHNLWHLSLVKSVCLYDPMKPRDFAYMSLKGLMAISRKLNPSPQASQLETILKD